jgi:hypothetical protein
MESRRVSIERLSMRTLALLHQAFDIMEEVSPEGRKRNDIALRLADQVREDPWGKLMELHAAMAKVLDVAAGKSGEGSGLTVQSFGALYVRAMQSAQPVAIEEKRTIEVEAVGTSRVLDKLSHWD